MILLADSGSSKTDWWLIDNHQVIKKLKTIGLNPYFVNSQQVREELLREFSNVFELDQVQQVYFYGAGSSSPTKKAVIHNALKSMFPQAYILVEHDLLASARALHGNQPGIACILGTGSNACLYDGNTITESLFSLGYMFGDEGSGAHLGKSYIAAHLKKRVPQEIHQAFMEHYSYTDEEILTHIYQREKPNRFLASFTVFLKSQLHHPYVSELVERCFDEFFTEQVSKFTNYQEMRFGCIGSVGFHFQEILNRSASKHNIVLEIYLVSPMEGLMEYHRE